MPNRDLLILGKRDENDSFQMQIRLRDLNAILYEAESMSVFCQVNEIIDINRYKIIKKPYLIEAAVRDNTKPFVFIFNKN